MKKDLTKTDEEDAIKGEAKSHYIMVRFDPIADASKTLTQVLEDIAAQCTQNEVQTAVFAYTDCPFLNEELTKELIETHIKYAAEYTYADGYPAGLAPEVLDAGVARILCEISKTVQKEMGNTPMTRTAIWDLIKTDVNSFEVETIIAKRDYRLWRLSFNTATKQGRMSCEAVQKALGEDAAGVRRMDADDVCQAAIRDIHAVRTVPGFYQIEIARDSQAGPMMALDKFRGLVQEIKELSPDAVISLSLVNDPMEHPDFLSMVQTACQARLSLLVETNGDKVNDEVAAKCRAIWLASSPLGRCEPLDAANTQDEGDGSATVTADGDGEESVEERKLDTQHSTFNNICGDNKIMWVVRRPNDSNVALLAKYFPGDVYPQMIRTKASESMLETFYCKWSAPDSPSQGRVLITKYCSYCGTKSDEKPCDLSPLERNPCWHLRRDMVILSDGTVPLCFARVNSLSDKDNVLGNAFECGVGALWDKMEAAAQRDLECDRGGGEVMDKLCGKCDEYYTFNF